MSGKALRLKRIVSPADGRRVILPLDHGITLGPITGIERIQAAIDAGVRGGADAALVLHKGMMGCLEATTGPMPAMIMHLSASTNLGLSCYHKSTGGAVGLDLFHPGSADGRSIGEPALRRICA